MTSQTQNPQKVGGSFFLLIPHTIRGELDGSEPMQWTKTGPRTYAITAPAAGQDGNSRTLKQGAGVKVRMPREAISEHGTDRPWTMRKEAEQLIVEAADEREAQPFKAGEIIATETGLSVIVRTAKAGDGRTLCANLTPSDIGACGLTIEVGTWQGYAVDLTRFVVATPTPENRRGTLDKATLKAMAEEVARLF